jgi:hypothetical protein
MKNPRPASVVVAIAVAVWLVPASARQEAPAPFAITHGPYLQVPAATSMTVVWHTNRPAVSKVEYWTDDKSADGSGLASAASASATAAVTVQTATSAAHGLIDNDRTSHVVRLTGLNAGTTYRYRVISREFQGYEKQHIVKYGPTVSSGPFSFTTLQSAFARVQSASPSAPELQRNRPAVARGQPRAGFGEAGSAVARKQPPATLGAEVRAQGYSFTVFSDIHENAKRLSAMLTAVDWARTPFVVFNGDMVNDFMNVDQPFTGFLDASVFARTTPFVYVRGNHDVRGRFARRLTDYFPGYAPGPSSSAPVRTRPAARTTPSTMARCTSSCSTRARTRWTRTSTTTASLRSNRTGRSRQPGWQRTSAAPPLAAHATASSSRTSRHTTRPQMRAD